MFDEAHSGWIYHLGDAIFGNVLLLNVDNLTQSFDVYSSCVVSGKLDEFDVNSNLNKFDCILVNLENNSEFTEEVSGQMHSMLRDGGVIAVVSKNNADFMGSSRPEYLLYFVKKIFSLFFNKHKKNNEVTHYMQCSYGAITEVIYPGGYRPVKNVFTKKEKLKSVFLSRYLYRIFSSAELVVHSNRLIHKTVIDNVVEKVSDLTGCVFDKINSCRVIPYKILLSVSGGGRNYIFLFLRGSDRNVRANKELKMLGIFSQKYPELKQYIAEPVTNGIYKNVEYIVYTELSGVFIDSYFKQFDEAKSNAFEVLKYLSSISQVDVELKDDFLMPGLFEGFSLLHENPGNGNALSSYLIKLDHSLRDKVRGKIFKMVLFHGDFKIENLVYDESDYSVLGIIDWDLSQELSFPGMDLLYFIFYNRRIKNKSSFIDECNDIFIGEGFNNDEQSMIREYCDLYSVTDDLFSVVIVFFVIHHFSYRERFCYNDKWLLLLLSRIECI